MSTERVGRTVSYPDWMARRGGTVPWREVAERLDVARNYWVASVRADGRPHTRPVWGAWVDDRLVLSAGGGYWMLRNLRRNPQASAHPEEAEGLVVVVEGVVVSTLVLGEEHLRRALDAYNAKYDWDLSDEEFRQGVEIQPSAVFAWRTGDRDFHDYDATRFDFA